MEFRILGPIEVVDRGRAVAIRRGKEQALRAYLLLHPNEVVASDRLVDELWGERPPPTTGKILQNAVSQLRKALGDHRLVTRPPGYLLRVEPGELDLERFEFLAERGRADGGGKLLREALELWRGEPLAEFRDEPFAREAARRLEEARLGAREDRIESDLGDGRHIIWRLNPETRQADAVIKVGGFPSTSWRRRTPSGSLAATPGSSCASTRGRTRSRRRSTRL